jgi:hypothetical protein
MKPKLRASCKSGPEPVRANQGRTMRGTSGVTGFVKKVVDKKVVDKKVVDYLSQEK